MEKQKKKKQTQMEQIHEALFCPSPESDLA